MRAYPMALLLVLAAACSPGIDNDTEAFDGAAAETEGLVRFDVYPPQESGLRDDRGNTLDLRPQTFVVDLTLQDQADLVMTPAARIRGVVEGEALTPWPTAEVPTVTDILVDAELRFGLEGNIQQPRVETDGDGRYEVLVVPSDVPYELAVTPSDPNTAMYAERVTIDGSELDIDVFIEAGVPLWGAVTDSAGDPMEGLTVNAVNEQGLGSASVLTDAKGRYLLTVAPGQSYTVQVGPPTGVVLPTVRRRTEVVEEAGMQLSVALPTTTVTAVGGPVITPSGGLVRDDDVRVHLVAEQIQGFEPGEASYEVEVGTDNGRFDTRVPPGTYRVEVAPQDPEGPSPLALTNIRVGTSITSVDDLALQSKTARVGVVSDDTGQRIGGAKVTCTETGFAGRTWNTTSDPDGGFVLTVPLADATCALSPPANLADQLALTQQTLAGDIALDESAEWTLVIATGSVVRGRIEARGEARLDGDILDVLPSSVVEVRDFSGRLLGVAISDENGEFEIRVSP
ncbi:MAG: carboxypeptidase regulatory-like domain-containing protein [Myxococcota bacterium]